MIFYIVNSGPLIVSIRIWGSSAKYVCKNWERSNSLKLDSLDADTLYMQKLIYMMIH